MGFWSILVFCPPPPKKKRRNKQAGGCADQDEEGVREANLLLGQRDGCGPKLGSRGTFGVRGRTHRKWGVVCGKCALRIAI